MTHGRVGFGASKSRAGGLRICDLAPTSMLSNGPRDVATSGFRVQGLGLVEVQRSGFTGISEIRTSQSTKQTVSPCRTQYKYSKADPKQDSLYQGPSRPRVAEGLDFGNTPWLLHGGPELESTQH